MLPGFDGRLPAAAQDVVERALLDNDLADAPPDDERWVKLYDEIQRLVKKPPTSGAPIDTDDMDDSSHRWATDSDEESTTTSCANTAFEANAAQNQDQYASLLPNRAMSDAVHGFVSAALTNKKGVLTKGLISESWEPASLAAMSILVEEVARSQAHFNAQRTMFAKSPRNQALAAKRQAKKDMGKGKGKGNEKDSGTDK